MKAKETGIKNTIKRVKTVKPSQYELLRWDATIGFGIFAKFQL